MKKVDPKSLNYDDELFHTKIYQSIQRFLGAFWQWVLLKNCERLSVDC